MKTSKRTLWVGAILASLPLATALGATLVIGDNYDVAGTGTGFALNTGLNSGINPPTTRLTGVAAANLRYFLYSGGKSNSLFSIGTNQFYIARGDYSSTITLGPGSGAYDFSLPLRAVNATPGLPSVYEIRIKMAASPLSTQRFSFGLSTELGGVTTWDFGLQIYRPNTADTFYTVARRIDMASSGGAADLDTTIATTAPGTWTTLVPFLIRVTDAGAETTAYSSRVQVSMDEGATWIYDTATDPELPSGWRLDTAGRYFFWDCPAWGRGAYDDFSVNWISGPQASMAQVWTGGGADAHWSTPGNWVSGMVPNDGDKLTFNGAARQASVNDIDSLTVPWVAFNNGGFELTGNVLTLSGAVTNLAGKNTLGLGMAWATASAKSWYVAPQSELVLGGVTLLDVIGNHTLDGGGLLHLTNSFQVGSASTANPAFIINAGQFLLEGPSANFTSRGGFRVGSLAATTNCAELIVSNGATFYLNTGGGGLRVGDSANSVVNRLIVDQSTLMMTGGTLGVGWVTGATSEVRQTGGTVSGCVLSFNVTGAGVGTYTIKNGTLEPMQIMESIDAGEAEMYFDNAILRTALGVKSPFMSGLDVAEIRSGGLTLDINQADVVISSSLSGAGSLTKVGLNAATLTGTNTYAGKTLVQTGKLVLPTVQTNAGDIQVADATELGVKASTPGTTLTAGSLSVGASSSSSLSFDLSGLPNPVAPFMQVSSLSANGTVTVTILGNSPLTTPGTITLIKYSGAIGGAGFGGFTLGSLPVGMQAHLANNPGSLDLVITAVQGFRWTGAASSDWDSMTANWISMLTQQPGAYTDGFKTEFVDGATRGSVAIVGMVSPAVVTVSNNALAYTFSGGTIATPLLRKAGTNSLTRLDGYDQIAELELNDGAFVVNNSYDASFATRLTDTSDGQGSLVKRGQGTLTVVSNSSSFDGAILIQEGVFQLGADGALGSTNGATTVQPGASLDVVGLLAQHEPVIASGAGFNGQGAIFSSSANNNGQNLTEVEMVGDTTFGGTVAGGRWDIRARLETGPAPGLRGNGYKFTKVGPGSMVVACMRTLTNTPAPFWDLNLGDVVVSEGWMSFEEAVSLGNPARTITVLPGSTLNFRDLGVTNPVQRNLTITDASLNTSGANGSTTNVFNGSVAMNGAVRMEVTRSMTIFNGPLSGNASLNLSAVGSGRVMLNAANTYTGDTTLKNGTLGGNGTIAGNLIMLAGTLTPGMGVGTLTVNGNATLAGTTVFELDRGQTPNSDRLVVGGILTLGGTLQVVLAANPQPGDVYQLFNKAGMGGFTNLILPDLSGLPGAMSWDTNNLAVNGTLKVNGTLTPPSIGTVSVSGGNFVFSGTGGAEGGTYYVLTSTNLLTPMANWVPVATNVFGPGGSFSFTNSISTAVPESFFRLQLP